jgi:hypothetical protein
MSADELPYVRAAFAESIKRSSNALDKLPWATFKRDVRPRLYHALDDAEVLVADLDGNVAGWIALTRGRRVDTVHWMTTRMPLRRRSVMQQLVAAAALKDRIVYTHRPRAAVDEQVTGWLRRRGAQGVVYEPYERWKL